MLARRPVPGVAVGDGVAPLPSVAAAFTSFVFRTEARRGVGGLTDAAVVVSVGGAADRAVGGQCSAEGFSWPVLALVSRRLALVGLVKSIMDLCRFAAGLSTVVLAGFSVVFAGFSAGVFAGFSVVFAGFSVVFAGFSVVFAGFSAEVLAGLSVVFAGFVGLSAADVDVVLPSAGAAGFAALDDADGTDATDFALAAPMLTEPAAASSAVATTALVAIAWADGAASLGCRFGAVFGTIVTEAG